MPARQKRSHPVKESTSNPSADAIHPSEPRREMPTWIWWSGILASALVSRLAADHFPPVQAAERFMAAHRAAFVGSVISMAAIGLLLLVATLIQLALRGGPSVSTPIPDDPLLRRHQPTPLDSVSGFHSVYWFKGKAVGIEVHDEWTAGGMKAAWRSGDWSRTPLWRRRYMAFTGIIFLVFGGFGICIVLAQAWVALLCCGFLLYAAVRIAWMFWRA